MDKQLADTLRSLSFQELPSGAMKGCVGDVEVVAVEHPLKGVCLIVSHIGKREATQFERFIPRNLTQQQIAAVLVEIFEQIHPEDKNGFPQK